ncbi:MAG: hypothetical protein AAF560_18600 [Acidobacteriota bacterium]
MTPVRPLTSRYLAVLAITLMILGANPSWTQAQEPTTAEASRPNRSPQELWQHDALTHIKPFQRVWWGWQQRAYPGDEIPSGARQRALEQIAAWQAANPDAVSRGGTPATWTSIGPRGIDLGGLQYSGRVADVAIDQTDADRWLIGAAHGGIWETTDAGTSWTPLTDDQASLAMGAIAFAPSDPSIVYAGTGESAFSGDAYGGAGLLKSTDGGVTWTLIAADTFDERAFSDIQIHPTDPDTLVASTSRGLIGSFSGSTALPVGIFKSADGGDTWTHTLAGDDATDLEVDPADFNRQYTGLGEVFGGMDNGVYRSSDAGDSWLPVSGPWDGLAGGVGRVELAIAPSDRNVLYVGIQDAFDGAGLDGQLLGLWTTSNAWDAIPSWTPIDTTAANGICGAQCWYDFELKVDPSDSSVIYAGGVSLWKRTGGVWSNVRGSAHVDQHSMAIDGSLLVLGNDGGVWSSTNGGASWTDHNDDLALTQFYHGSSHPTDAGFAIGGSQDNGTEARSTSDTWTFVFGGDGADNAISTANPDLHWAISTQFQSIRRTLDGGGTFTFAGAGIDTTNAPFISVFKMCDANPETLIAGTDNLWRTDVFFGGPPVWSSNGPELGSGLTAMAFAPADADCDTYAIGLADGRLQITTDGGVTWVDLDPSNQVPDRFVTDVAFDPNDASTLFVTLSGFAPGGHLYRSDNALSATPTWADVSPPVDTPHNAIVATPDGRVFVGTDLGVWESLGTGGPWTYFSPADGLPNVVIYDLQYRPGTDRLIAFTHGRGAFALDTSGLLFADGFESGNTSLWSNTMP